MFYFCYLKNAYILFEICYKKNKSLFFWRHEKWLIFSFKYFVIFNMITDPFLVKKLGTLERAKRYVWKRLLDLDCQGSISFVIFQGTIFIFYFFRGGICIWRPFYSLIWHTKTVIAYEVFNFSEGIYFWASLILNALY